MFGRGRFCFLCPTKQEDVSMTLYEELQARGLVAQITDNEIIDLINNG